MTQQDYLRDPCGQSSVPFWKIAAYPVPDTMKILHEREFDPALLATYRDEPYFRLMHSLKSVWEPTLPEGFSFCDPEPEVFADHIQVCYPGIRMAYSEIRGFTHRSVFCEDLWIAIREERTGCIAATGIGEWDRETGEGTLEWIQVSKGFRGLGLGKAIVLELLKRMKGKVGFATVSGQCNNSSNPEKLYRKCGFTGNNIWHILRKK